MTELRPTYVRMALLAEVAAGRVKRHPAVMGYAAYAKWEPIEGRGREVTKRMDDMEKAGWVRQGPPNGASFFSARTYLLTGAGHERLNEWRAKFVSEASNG